MMSWISSPIKSSLWKVLFFLMVILITSTLIYLNTNSTFWTFFSIIVLIISVHDFLIPTTYQLTEKTVSSKNTFFHRKKNWSSLGSYWIDNNGIFLSPFSQRSRLEGYRGLYLRFSGTDRQLVMNFVKRKFNEQSSND